MIRALGILIVSAVATTAIPVTAMASQDVPCGVYNKFNGYVRPGPCANPIESGVVDGQWIGVVVIYSGGNGGATSAHLYAAGHGGNGPLTVDMGQVNAVTEYEGAGPDELQIAFHYGKLIATNKLAHDLWKEFIARQFGFHDGKLVVEKTAKFTYERKAWSQSDFDAAAASALANVSSRY